MLLVPVDLFWQLGCTEPALAGKDKSRSDWMPVEKVRQKLRGAAYISKAKADDGRCDGGIGSDVCGKGATSNR